MEIYSLLITLQALLLLLIPVFVLFTISWRTKEEQYGMISGFAVVGVQDELFAWSRAAFRSLTRCGEWATDGYTNYIKANYSYIIQTMDRGPMLVVQPSEIKNIYSLPGDRLDQTNTTYGSLQVDYTVQDQGIIRDDFHLNVIRNQITRNLDTLTQPMVTEIEKGFDRTFGRASDGWRELPLWHTCMSLVAGVANGALCGAPLCRDEDFLNSMRDHATCVFSGAIVINAVPRLLRPIVGLPVRWLCSYYYNKALKKCLPLVRQRTELTSRVRRGAGSEMDLPRDGLQWIIEEAFKKPDPGEQAPVRLAERLIFVNDVSMHTTSYTVSNLIMNLFSSASSADIEALREECQEVFREANGIWTRQAVQKLRLLDSALRESMRISSFSVFGLPRTVYDPNGLSIAHGESSINIPKGTIIALPVHDVHKDPRIYTNAHLFQPLRFVVSKQGEARPNIEGGTGRGKHAVTLDDSFLGFGCGKHACPGRFFAVHEMKLVVAYLLLNYEVKPIMHKPSSTDFIWMKLYTHRFKIQVRRIVK